MNQYTVMENLYFSKDDKTVLAGEVIELAVERADKVNAEIPGALVLLVETGVETPKPKRTKKTTEAKADEATEPEVTEEAAE